MPQLTLYRANGACSLVVHTVLHHLSIPHSTVRMAWGPDGTQSADGSLTNAQYRSIHPAGYVPALKVVENNTVTIVTELPAILLYVCTLSSESRDLVGQTPLEQAKINEWIIWLSGTVHGQGYRMLWRPSYFSDDTTVHEQIIETGRRLIKDCYDRIESKTGENGHAIGQKLTLVDFVLFLFWTWGLKNETGLNMPAFAKFGRLAEMMKQLGSVQTVIKEEGLVVGSEK